MSVIFSSDWATGDITDGGKWTEVGSGELSISSTVNFFGKKALEFNSDNTQSDYLHAALANGGDVGIRFALRVDSFFEYYNSFVMYCRLHNLASYGQLLEFGADCDSTGYNCDSSIYPTSLYLWSDGAPNMVVGSIFQIALTTWYQVRIRNIQSVSQAWELWDAAGANLLYSAINTTGVPDYSVDDIRVSILENPGGANHFYIADLIVNQGDWADLYIAPPPKTPGINIPIFNKAGQI